MRQLIGEQVVHRVAPLGMDNHTADNGVEIPFSLRRTTTTSSSAVAVQGEDSACVYPAAAVRKDIAFVCLRVRQPGHMDGVRDTGGGYCAGGRGESHRQAVCDAYPVPHNVDAGATQVGEGVVAVVGRTHGHVVNPYIVDTSASGQLVSQRQSAVHVRRELTNIVPPTHRGGYGKGVYRIEHCAVGRHVSYNHR